ncbi:MAG: hypothetical protein M1541_00395 [Acidobacteria bacterium]|nr:hypothetical protein [Acidobacteriota bacterium]
MDLSVGKVVGPLPPGTTQEQWEKATAHVVRYLAALNVRDQPRLSRLVPWVLNQATERFEAVPGTPPLVAATDALDEYIVQWFRTLMALEETDPAEVSQRGRLALLITKMPPHGRDEFLSDPPWPEEFVEAVRLSYLRTGPDSQFSRMRPRPLDLGPIPLVVETGLWQLDRAPVFRAVIVSAVFGAAFGLLFYFTR